MNRRIEKVAVLGAGTMGARIAAHMANAGVPCYLLDIVPSELAAEEKSRGLAIDNPLVRNRIVRAGLEAAKKARPAAFFTPDRARLITTGNFEDNRACCAEADWIIEAVAGNLELNPKLLARVEQHRKPGTLVTTNTSGLPICRIAEDASDDFQRHWAGTHFFNPPRYMKLVELIPGPKTQPDVVETLRDFCDRRLGKGVVVAKDRPNFIANRIGTFSMLNVLRLMTEVERTVEEVDACPGPAVGWQKMDYRTRQKARFASIEAGKTIEATRARLRTLLARIFSGQGGDKGAKFLWGALSEMCLYAARRVPEIADAVVDVDRAMRWGFAWELGPFEIWDAVGVEVMAKQLEHAGKPLPPLITRLLSSGQKSFYQSAQGRVSYFDLASAAYKPVVEPEGVIILKSLKERSREIENNPGASLIDLGDGVVCCEFHGKMNAIEI